MPILPRTMPEEFHTELTEALTSEGIEFVQVETTKRVAYKARYAEREWTITYLLQMSGSPEWSLIGPGIEWGPSVETEEIVSYIKG